MRRGIFFQKIVLPESRPVRHAVFHRVGKLFSSGEFPDILLHPIRADFQIPDEKTCGIIHMPRRDFFRVAAHHLTGVPLQYMPIRPDVLLCCINRRGKRIIPRGHDVLHEGDTVIVVSTFEGMNDLQDIFLPTAGGREK